MVTTLRNITELEEQYQLATYKKMPIVAERGEGVWVFTSDGDRYLDLYGGHAVAGTGHCHPHVVNALRAQAGELLFYSNLVYSNARARAPKKWSRSLPTNSRKHSSATPAPKPTRTRCAWRAWPPDANRSSPSQGAFTVELQTRLAPRFSASIASSANQMCPALSKRTLATSNLCTDSLTRQLRRSCSSPSSRWPAFA